MFVTSNAKEADSGKLSRSWDIRIMDIRDAQKYHDVERLNAVNNAFPRGWRTSEPKQAENTITADPHRCYGRLPITRQLRKACPRLYRGPFELSNRLSHLCNNLIWQNCQTRISFDKIVKWDSHLYRSRQKYPGSQKCPGRQASFMLESGRSCRKSQVPY